MRTWLCTYRWNGALYGTRHVGSLAYVTWLCSLYGGWVEGELRGEVPA
jgi:hypothetical protein